MAIFNSYVSLPESNYKDWMIDQQIRIQDPCLDPHRPAIGWSHRKRPAAPSGGIYRLNKNMR